MPLITITSAVMHAARLLFCLKFIYHYSIIYFTFYIFISFFSFLCWIFTYSCHPCVEYFYMQFSVIIHPTEDRIPQIRTKHTQKSKYQTNRYKSKTICENSMENSRKLLIKTTCSREDALCWLNLPRIIENNNLCNLK